MALLAKSDVACRSKDRALATALIKSYLCQSEEKLSGVLEPYFNPIYLLAGIASVTGGRTVAQSLVQLGRNGCLAKAAEAVGVSVQDAREEATADSYDGPFRVFCDQKRWESVVAAANSPTENALSGGHASDSAKSLLLDLTRWFAAVTLTQDSVEGTIKVVKNLHPTQRGSIETVSRVVRARRNRGQCLHSVPDPAFQFTRACLWPPVLEQKQPAPELRLTFSEENPNHPALPRMTSTERTAINRSLGFNSKPSTEEREAKRAHVETMVPETTHAAVVSALRLDFAVAELPSEPTLEDTPRRKRKAASAKSKRKCKRKNGKDERDWQDSELDDDD